MLERAKERLESFGSVLKDGDEVILTFSIQKVENTIKNDCNVPSIPDGLMHIAVDMAVGEFLSVKKTFSPDDIAGGRYQYGIRNRRSKSDAGTEAEQLPELSYDARTG